MLDRTVAPAFREIEHISIKEARKTTIENDIGIFSINAGTQPVIKLEFIFESGKWSEQKAGTAFFTAKMLREGAGELNSYDISNTFESVGAHLEIVPSLDFTSITIYSLEKHLEKLMPVVKAMILEPIFPEKEFETFKNIQVQTLRVNNEKNSFVAGRKFRETLFGKHHPYGYILSEEDIFSLKKADLEKHFKQNLFEKPFTIIVSGQVDNGTFQKLERTFGNININPVEENSKSFELAPGNKVLKIDKEDSVQSSLRMGNISIPMKHPDYASLLFTNEILGGYFGSRLMKNIREEKGLTYGIYSTLSSLQHKTFFSVSADVKKDLREQAFEEIRKEIILLRTEPVENTELETVKNYMLGQIQASINTPFALAAKFKNVYFNGLTYDYYKTLVKTIREITPKQIQETAYQYLDEKEMAMVYVG